VKLPPAQKSLEKARELALEELKSVDPKRAAKNCGGTIEGGVITLPVLHWVARVDIENGTVSAESEDEIPPRVQVLILRYLAAGGKLSSQQTEPTGYEIAFGQLPAGAFYRAPFEGRVTERLLKIFDGKMEDFLKCAIDLGGRKAKYGDASWTFDFFPKVPITIVLWRGDEELPHSGNVIFDAGIQEFMTTEDVVVACEELVSELARRHKALYRDAR